MIMAGSLHLIPVTLGGNDFRKVIPEWVLSLTIHLRIFIVEDLRSARRYLRLIDKDFPIDDTLFFELNEHTDIKEIESFLQPVKEGRDAGILSEAGLPGIADPGSRLVRLAHKSGIRVVPHTGPSSILLALISSGMNGQNFTFHGYLPQKNYDRIEKLKEVERKALTGQAQIFIETPYRAEKMAGAIISTCRPDLTLCIAADITLESELISTKTIQQWRKSPPDIDGRLVVFVLGL